MRILILNRFTLARTHYKIWSDPLNELVLITSRDSLSTEPAARVLELAGFSHVEIVDNYADSSMPEYLAHLLNRDQAFDRILAMSEFDLLRAARLRDIWGIRGQSVAQATLFRDKVSMKDRLASARVPVAPYRAIDNASTLIAAAEQLGYPLVIKPRFGAASVGITIVQNETQLRAFLESAPLSLGDAPSTLLAESFVSNALFHIDGIVDAGQVAICWPSEQTASCLDITLGAVQLSTALETDDPRLAALQDMTVRAITALGIEDDALFHAEIFATHDGFVFNEVGCRVGGAKIRDMLEHGFGVDPIEWFARAHLGSRSAVALSSVPLQQTGFALVPTLPGRIAEFNDFEVSPVITLYEPKFAVGDVMGDPSSSSTVLASFVSRAYSRNEVISGLSDAVAALQRSLIVEPAGGATIG